jgi:hypothetical protein
MYRHSGWKHFPKEEPSPFDGAWNIAAILFLVAFYGLFAVGLILWAATPSPGRLENHDLHHAQYRDWQSNAGFGCCDQRDCGTLDPNRVREKGDHTEVLVSDDRGDQWCPIEWKHLVNQQSGKRLSPDWTVDHACIIGQNFAATTCERLKCFMEKGKF